MITSLLEINGSEDIKNGDVGDSVTIDGPVGLKKGSTKGALGIKNESTNDEGPVIEEGPVGINVDDGFVIEGPIGIKVDEFKELMLGELIILGPVGINILLYIL